MLIRALDVFGVLIVLGFVVIGIPVIYIHVPMPSADEMRDWR